MSAPDTLPDSRLTVRPDLGAQMVDWPLPDGTTVRLEAIKVFCANCGVFWGWCPKENTTWACWLCNKCYETYGEIAGTLAVPDEEFRRKVQYEIRRRFGRDLTEMELLAVIDQDDLGKDLELLAKESPYTKVG